MILTTSPTIEGVPIKAYLRPLSSHVVLGANIFSDFAAGLRDVFGGRSQSYQKQLKRLTDTVLYELESEAKALKADAVVGIDIDFSEMSGGGKAGMLMAIATGTAVILTRSQGELETRLGRMVDREQVEAQVKKVDLISRFRNMTDDVHLNMVFKELITEGVHDVSDEVIAICSEDGNAYLRESLSRYAEMCTRLKGYRWTLESGLTNDSVVVQEVCVQALSNSEEFRLKDLIPLAGEVKAPFAGGLMQAVCLHQEYYTESDLNHCLDLHDAIKTAYPLKAEKTITKGMMGKETEVWICECGGKMIDSQCKKCLKDPWGFHLPKTSVGKALRALEELAGALKSMFAST